MKRAASISLIYLISIAFGIILLTPFSSFAQRALIPVLNEYVYLSASRETVIVAWNGTEEILVITDELAASKETKVVRFIPFPKKPAIKEVDDVILKQLDTLIAKNGPKITVFVNGRKTTKNAVVDVDLTMNAKSAPRDTVVVKLDSIEAFERWASDYLKKAGIADPKPVIDKYRWAVGNLIQRNITYFVFDVVTVPEKKIGIKPVVYRFQTDCLYVPFSVSGITSGAPEVNLVLVTPGHPKKIAVPYPFSPIDYKIPDGVDFAKYPDLLKRYNPLTYSRDNPVSFAVNMIDRVSLLPLVGEIIPGWKTQAELSAFRYKGSLSSLSEDLTLYENDFESPDFESVKKALAAARNFRKTVPEDMLDLLSGPALNHFTTGGTDPYTSSAAVDGDASTPYLLPLNGEWVIDLSEERLIEGVDIYATVTKPDIVPSKNKLYLYVSDTGKFSGEERRIDTCVVRSRIAVKGNDDPTTHVERVVLTDRSFSTRFLKITYPYSESISNLYLLEVRIWTEKQ